MKSVKITEENINLFIDKIDADVAENISRDPVHGIALCDDGYGQLHGVIVWELTAPGRDRYFVSKILWLWFDGQKNGRKLLGEYAKEIAGKRIKESIYEFPLSDESKKDLLEEAEFGIIQEESPGLTVTLGELAELKALSGKEIPGYITGIDSIMVEQFRQGIEKCTSGDKKGFMKDLNDIPMFWFEPQVSSCLHIDGIVKGFLLVHRRPSGVLVIDYLNVEETKVKEDILSLMQYSLNAALKKYGRENSVLLYRHSSELFSFVGKLLPHRKADTVYMAKRKI